ncbi:hypothetical protein L218DRAFT_619734 [Marasmius fiardii PR-910]|nr:hypothetical protein L218DRAFT_619734 [Marasmius fiardii PR-910]
MSDAVGLTIELFSLAIKAYEKVQKAIEFPERSHTLALKLDHELFRLHLWGKHSGMSEGSVVRELSSPFVQSLIRRELDKLHDLLQDTEKLKERYGLISIDRAAVVEKDPSRLQRLRHFIRSITDKVKSPSDIAHNGAQKNRVSQLGAFGLAIWAISSEERFTQLVGDIRDYVDRLNELLHESQQTRLNQDRDRTQAELVNGVDDSPSLLWIKEMSEGDPTCQNLKSMASRKAIANDPDLGPPIPPLPKEHFELPNGHHMLPRFIALYKPPTSSTSPPDYVLVERKRFPLHASIEDTLALLSRLKRLIHMLNTPSENDLGILPTCLGYWNEPQNHSWCLVYRRSFSPSSTIPPIKKSLSTAQPCSLLYLLKDPKFKPALDLRFDIAAQLASVFFRLFGGEWLHKAIRSDNIVFSSQVSPDPDADNSLPLIVGFEYSRQYTELTSIDFVPQEFSQALYRHPDYQGEGAHYRLSYDIYSFGLVLAEIAWWVPLEKIYQEAARKKTPGVPSEYGTKEARAFMEEIRRKVKREISFRVSYPYRKALEWCLEQGVLTDATEKELVVSFHSNVVVPLEALRRPL